MTSLFGGSGFIGSGYAKMFPNEVFIEKRDSEIPKYNNILWALGTVDNYSIFTDNPTIDFDVNVNKLIRILHNCKDRPINITLLSSWFCFGGINLKRPYKETDIGNPLGYYSISKVAQRQVLITFCTFYKKKYKIINLSNIYGPGDKKVSNKKNALTYLINKLKNNETIELYNGGDVKRDYLHINDCVRGIKLIIDKGKDNSIYNLGYGISPYIGDIIKYVKKRINSKSKIKSISPTDFHKIVQVRDFEMDTGKVNQLGFYPEINLTAGLETIIH